MMKVLGWMAGVLLVTVIGAQAQVLTDDFEDGVLDPAKWIPREPFATSKVTEADGVLRLTQRGTVTAVTEFGPCVISCRFRFASHRYDIFEVALRSDGEPGGVNGRPRNGLIVYIRPTDNPDSVEVALIDSQLQVALLRAASPVPILMNEYYVLTIEDDGAALHVSVNDQPAFSYQTTTDYGDRIQLGNRSDLFNTPDLITEIDWVDIHGTKEALDIRANGSDGPVILARGTPLTITADLLADPAVAGDTWILALTSQFFPFNIFSYDVRSGSWFPWLFTFNGPSAQGPIPTLESTVLLHADGLPAGFYTFYLGYDPTQNRQIDFEGLQLDAVSVYIGN